MNQRLYSITRYRTIIIEIIIKHQVLILYKIWLNYKYYHVACTIQTLSTIEEITKKNAEGEEDGGGDATTTPTNALSGNRLPNTLMNINKAIDDKEYEHLTLNEMFTITHIFMHYKVYPASNED